MTTTILIFIVLLSGYPSSQLTAIPWDNTVLHYLMPIAVILDWVIVPPARAGTLASSMACLGFPLAYLVYSLIRGPLVHWSPQPFINPSRRGYLGVALASIVIAAVLGVITLIVASTPRWKLPHL